MIRELVIVDRVSRESKGNANSKMLQLDERSNGSEIKLASSDILEICLSENRTTGYRWLLESSGEVCVLLSDSFKPGHATGEPGEHCWKFRAERAGSGAIELSYRRTWSGEKAAAGAFTITLEVS